MHWDRGQVQFSTMESDTIHYCDKPVQRDTLIQTTPTAKVGSTILFRKRKILKQYFFNHDSRH